MKKLWKSGDLSEMQLKKILSYGVVAVVCLCIGLGIGKVQSTKIDRPYRELLAIYIAEVERTRSINSDLEATNRDLRTELERQRGTLDRAREIVDGFEHSAGESVGGVRRALRGLQALRELLETLENN